MIFELFGFHYERGFDSCETSLQNLFIASSRTVFLDASLLQPLIIYIKLQ